MKKTLNVLLVLALVAVLFVSCGKKEKAAAPVAEVKTETKVETKVETKAETKAETKVEAPVTYATLDDEAVYASVLGDYEDLCNAALAADSIDERFALFAQAEAYLLDSAVMMPTTTQGGRYAISRIAYRSTPYVNWGNDDDRWYSMVISDDFISKEERADLKAMWEKAVKGEAEYDAIAYLTSKGHSIKKDYVFSFTTAPVTLDTLNTSSQSDTEILVNCTDNLVQYNNLGQMIPSMAETWSVSDDGLTYTFNIRKGAYWYTSEGTPYAEVTAADFEAGFQHMLDAEAGLEWLVDGVVKGASEYLYEGGSWANVGYKAVDKYTLQVTLEAPTSYFLTMLTYSCFSPICKSFFEARGGVLGKEAYAEAYAAGKVNYGLATDVSSQVYNGAFLLQKLNADSEIKVVKNQNYWNKDAVVLDSITWIYDDGSNPTQTYNECVKGTYAGVNLTDAIMPLAKADGNFDKYSYVSDTTSTTYFAGLNMNRATFGLASGAVASLKSEAEKVNWQNAVQNKNFRKALFAAFDKESYNAVSVGAEVTLYCLRNMYTHPEFVQLENAVTDKDGHTFPAGTMYGEMVQYYLTKLGSYVNVADSTNGWYNPAESKKFIEAAKKELGNSVTWPVHVEIVYYSASTVQVGQANAVKQSIENNLGKENVIVDLIEATTTNDFYAVGYRASNGAALGQDMFYGSGWGPDYGDPKTYLDTFFGNGAGYMTKVIGLF